MSPAVGIKDSNESGNRPRLIKGFAVSMKEGPLLPIKSTAMTD